MVTHPRRAYVDRPTLARFRRRKQGALCVLAGLLAGIVGVSSGMTTALWTDSQTLGSVSIQEAVVGLSLTRAGEAAVVSQNGQPVSFAVGPSTAQAMAASEIAGSGFAVAVPFGIDTVASGGYQVQYSVALDSPSPDTVFGMSTITLIRVDSDADCTVSAVVLDEDYSQGETVNGAGGSTSVVSTTDHWCLVIEGTAQAYENTATASGINAIGADEVSDSDDDTATWNAIMAPDPAQQPDMTVTVTPTLGEVG